MLRKSMVRQIVFAGLCALFFASGPTFGATPEYPTRPIIITVGFTPGGGSGISAQVFVDNAKKYLSKPQPILLTYKPGASTAIAADYVLKQPADGYTLLWLVPDLAVKIAEDPHALSFTLRDFVPIGTTGSSPGVLSVNKESPFKKFEDFIEYAKKNPGKFSYGTGGIGSYGHVMGEILQMQWGIKLKHIPFPGAAQSIAAVLGGHLDSYLSSVGGQGPHIKPGGGLRPLVVCDRERFPGLPDVPTSLERGYNVEYLTWFSLAAAKQTPREILDILGEVFRKTASDPQAKEALSRLGYNPVSWGPEETQKEMNKVFDMSGEVFKQLGLTK